MELYAFDAEQQDGRETPTQTNATAEKLTLSLTI
jgi:hypothetical protein